MQLCRKYFHKLTIHYTLYLLSSPLLFTFTYRLCLPALQRGELCAQAADVLYFRRRQILHLHPFRITEQEEGWCIDVCTHTIAMLFCNLGGAQQGCTLLHWNVS